MVSCDPKRPSGWRQILLAELAGHKINNSYKKKDDSFNHVTDLGQQPGRKFETVGENTQGGNNGDGYDGRPVLESKVVVHIDGHDGRKRQAPP